MSFFKGKVGKLFGHKAKEEATVEATVEPKAPAKARITPKPVDWTPGEDAAKAVPAVVAKTEVVPEAVAPAATAPVEAAPAEVAPAMEVKPETSEVIAVGEMSKLLDADKPAEPGDDRRGKIETIPLGEDEIRNLVRNHYEENKGRFPRTFLIEKGFWMRGGSSAPVRVRRVAELRAASLVHALNLIGWDRRNVTLIRETDDYAGEIAVMLDGKFVCMTKVPLDLNGEPFEKFGGGKRKEFVQVVRNVAVAEEKVKEALKARNRVVTGWAFEPRSHISLTTSKGPKPLALAVEPPEAIGQGITDGLVVELVKADGAPSVPATSVTGAVAEAIEKTSLEQLGVTHETVEGEVVTTSGQDAAEPAKEG